jgi:hypothetical protein
VEIDQSWNFGFDDIIEFSHVAKLRKLDEPKCNIDDKKKADFTSAFSSEV